MSDKRDDYRDHNSSDITCAFCGKHPHQVTAMISGPNGIYICDECISICANAMMRDMGMNFPAGNKAASCPVQGKEESFGDMPAPEDVLANLPTPHKLYTELSEYVIGQEQAKRALSVAVYNHYKRIGMDTDDSEYGDSDHTPQKSLAQNKDASRTQDRIQDRAGQDRAGNTRQPDINVDEAIDASTIDGIGAVELAKSNIMLLGPTGSGKTLLAQTLARTLRVPFAIADATTLTEAGYVGEDVENILLKLITAADFDIPRAEIGIVYIDEIDKVARKAENLSITRDVSGEGVQQALLKIIEGTEASVPPQGGRKHPQQELIHIDTTNILFILGGAFVGLSDIIAERVGTGSIGFNSEMPESKKASDAALLAQVLPEDLNKYGLIPEFIGRIPVVTSLKELSEDDLVRILVEPKNALIKQYIKMFAFDNSTLTFESNALRAIAHEAVEHGTGARGLRSICERVLLDVMYDLPEYEGETTVVVRASDITGETVPEIVPVSHTRATEVVSVQEADTEQQGMHAEEEDVQVDLASA